MTLKAFEDESVMQKADMLHRTVKDCGTICGRT